MWLNIYNYFQKCVINIVNSVMDFISYIRDQSERLNSRRCIDFYWNEIQLGAIAADAPDASIPTEYDNHLPLLLEQFWELCLEKLSEAHGQIADGEIDDELRIYLLVLLYQCTDQSKDTLSFKTTLCASKVYLYLLRSDYAADYYHSPIYKNVLNVVQVAIAASTCSDLLESLMKKLRKFLSKAELSEGDLEATLDTLTHIVYMKSSHIVDGFGTKSSKPIIFSLTSSHLIISDAN